MVVIPESAVQFEGESKYVMVRELTGDTRRDIETGISDGIRIEVVSGLSSGEKVRGAQIIAVKK